jgi:hypothetical protein
LAPYEISLLVARARATAAPGDPDRQVDVVKGLYSVSTAADVPRARAALDEAIALADALTRDGKLAPSQQDWPKLLRDALAKLPPSEGATRSKSLHFTAPLSAARRAPCIAPGVTRAAVVRDPAITSGIGQFAVLQYVSRSVGVEVSPVDVRDSPEIELGVAAFARSANGGLIVAGSPLSVFIAD